MLAYTTAIVMSVLALISSVSHGVADESLNVATGQVGAWETSLPELGQRAGIFRKHGLRLNILYTQGSGETQQAVIAGSADVATGLGTPGVLSAFEKGAPVRIIGAHATGPADFWYVRSDSSIQSFADVRPDTTVGFSTRGSSTNIAVLHLLKAAGRQATPTPTGSPATTLVGVMSNQIDVGWSTPPVGLNELDAGKIRIIARAVDVPTIRQQTVRVIVANANVLSTASGKDKVERFMAAYRETLDWLYTDPAAVKAFAEYSNIPLAQAERLKSEFFPKEMLDPLRLLGLESSVQDALEFKFISKKPSEEDLRRLVQVMPTTR